MRLLLISNGNDPELGYLGHARERIDALLADDARTLCFVPYASVLSTYDEYVAAVQEVLGPGRNVVGLHAATDPVAAVRNADAILVGGGNTWKLLAMLRDHGLLEPIAGAVTAGAPYIGWSAGANVACPTIATTNDMPVASPRGLEALGLVPFQINPHYLHGTPEGFQGESREQRIHEYLSVHPDVTVVGLREGTMLEVADGSVTLLGGAPCRVFRTVDGAMTADEIEPGDDVSMLMRTRLEHDSLGERVVPHDAYYGVQTLRAMGNFPISGIELSRFPRFIRALARVKKAAALANTELEVLDPERCAAIVAACDEIVAGRHHDHFRVDMVQGGAGTSTNMNANEVIANRGLELLGRRRGEYRYLHPNDDVNCSQSTNDAYPTALKLAMIDASECVVGAIFELQRSLRSKADEFSDVIKMGRTELQDAVPMTLGQEFAAYAVMVGEAAHAIRRAAERLHSLGMGATAIGTGITSPPGYSDLVTAKLVEVTGLPVTKADDLVEATQDSGDFVSMSAAMKRAAVQISKIANDLRLLSSGPRAGLFEIRLPPLQPGSSIMPGKVNPVIPEMVNVVCYQLIGFDVAVTMAAEASQLELNHTEPLIALDVLHGLDILERACRVFATQCIDGIVANREVCRAYVERSIGTVTALKPVLGYERSAAVANEALATDGNVSDLVVAKGWLTREQLDELLAPEHMTHPRALDV